MLSGENTTFITTVATTPRCQTISMKDNGDINMTILTNTDGERIDAHPRWRIIRAGLAMVINAIGFFWRSYRAHKVHRSLCDLDDRTLKDMGLCRSDLLFLKRQETSFGDTDKSQRIVGCKATGLLH